MIKSLKSLGLKSLIKRKDLVIQKAERTHQIFGKEKISFFR